MSPVPTTSPLLTGRALGHRDVGRRDVLRAGGAGLGALGLSLLAACSQEGGDPTQAAGSSSPASGSSASGSSGAEMTTISVALGWITNVEWAGLWLADDAGYYAEEGLTVEWQGGGPNAPSPMASVASGAADFGIATGLQALLRAISEGNDFSLTGAVFQDSPAAFLSLAGNPIRTVQDLVGKRVLGQTDVQPIVDAVFRIAGLEPDYEFVPAAFDPGPLVEGQGDVYTCYLTNQPIILEESYGLTEADYVVTPYSALGMPAYASIIFGQREAIAASRDVMTGFLRASIRGWQDNEADPEPAAVLAVEKYGVDLGLVLAQQVRENQLQIPLTQSALTEAEGLFRMDPEVMAGPMYEALAAAQVTGLPVPADVVDMSFLDEIYADGTVL